MRRAFATAVLATALAAQAASPVAFVADIRGNATIEGNGRLAFLTELATGTRLLLGTGATATITFAASGAEFTLEGPGEFAIGIGDVKGDKAATPPKRRTVSTLGDLGVVSRVSRSATASLRMRGLAPTPDPAALEYPVNTRIFSLQPNLRFRGTGAESRVTIRDGTGKAVWSGPAVPQREGTRIGVKLAPASRYSWEIANSRGTLGPASFETLPADAIARVEKSRAKGKAFSERVVGAIMLHELGATQDAREAWEELSRERPDLPELAALAG